MLSFKNLVDSTGSKNMNIDGSAPGAHQVFKCSPSSGNALSISKLTCLLVDPGSSALGVFQAPLSFGINIGVWKGNQVSLIKLIMDRSDLVQTFQTDAVFVENPSIFLGSFCFPEPLILTQNESLQVTIKDTLVGIGLLTMSGSCQIVK